MFIRKSKPGNVGPLMEKPKVDPNDILLNTSMLEVFEEDLPEVEQEPQPQLNPGVWPVEPNLLIEQAFYDGNFLNVILNNLGVSNVGIISMGVKYSNNMQESINFIPTDTILPPGECRVQIPAPRGKPYKFVLRTQNMTGTGSSLENMNW